MIDRPPSQQPLVTGLLRGLSVLRCFDYGRERLRVTDIARLTGLPQPTVWRLCRTLEHGGYLVAEFDGKTFRPGLSILTLGYAALDTLDLSELVRPHLQEIAAQFQAACSLSVREATRMLYLQRIEAPGAILSLNLRAGSEVPIISSGTGWGLLAGLAPAERDALLLECKRSDPSLFKKMHGKFVTAMERYEREGYMSNVDDFYPGLSTVSVPVRSAQRATPYVLNCTSATAVLGDPEKRRSAGQAVMKIAEQLLPIIERSRR